MPECVKFEIEKDEHVPNRWQVIIRRGDGGPVRCVGAALTLPQAKAALRAASRTAFVLGVPVAG
jgi:cytochrome P450